MGFNTAQKTSFCKNKATLIVQFCFIFLIFKILHNVMENISFDIQDSIYDIFFELLFDLNKTYAKMRQKFLFKTGDWIQ